WSKKRCICIADVLVRPGKTECGQPGFVVEIPLVRSGVYGERTHVRKSCGELRNRRMYAAVDLISFDKARTGSRSDRTSVIRIRSIYKTDPSCGIFRNTPSRPAFTRVSRIDGVLGWQVCDSKVGNSAGRQFDHI